MKRLFQVTLIVVILLLIVIHQSIAANANPVHLPYKHKELRINYYKNSLRSFDLIKKIKLSFEKQPDIVKEYVTKRSRRTNYC
jgi:hypothetical protein